MVNGRGLFAGIYLILREQINHKLAEWQNIQETGVEYHNQESTGIRDKPKCCADGNNGKPVKCAPLQSP
jgi:hypothetical protein